MQPNTDQWGQPIQPEPQPMLVGAPQPMVVGGVDPGMMTGRPAQMMGFIDSVKSVMMNNFANFNGRASRSEYWWFFLFTFIINIAISIVDMAVSIALGHETADTVWCGLILIYYLIFFIPSLSVGVRRMHDLGKSGWWILITAIPCIGIILYIVWVASEGEPHDNAYGPVPTNVLAPNLL